MSSAGSGAEMPTIAIAIRDSESAPYWEALQRHEFVLQRCEDCGQYQYYPRGICIACGSLRLVWTPASGRGQIYSYTISRRAPSPGYADLVPYIVALIDLAEGPRMLSTVNGPDAPSIGDAVQMWFDDVNEGITLPRFQKLEAGP